MHCPRFIIEPKDSTRAELSQLKRGSQISLTREQSHHLIRVLRRSLGDKVELVFSSSNSKYVAEISSPSVESCVVTLIEEIISDATLKICLFVAVTKKQSLEFISQHCSEAGVAEICFFQSKHSPHKLSSEKLDSFLSRVRKIAAGATQQSRSSNLCELNFVDSLGHALKRVSDQCSRTSTANSARKCILLGPAESTLLDSQPPLFVDFFYPTGRSYPEKAEALENKSECDEIYLMVGPEGGFCLEEIALAKSFGFSPCCLGPQVFRTETAALIASALAGMLAVKSKR